MSLSQSVQFGRIAEGKVFGGKPFPLVVTPTNPSSSGLSNLNDWLVSSRVELDSLLRDHKAILFRNFDLKAPNDFNEFVLSTGLEGMDYIGGAAPRSQVYGRVFTANESPSSEKIPFHHEMSQVPEPPTHILFFCEIPPSEGGETPILVSSEVCDRMASKHPAFTAKVESLGVKYIRVMPEQDDPTSAIGRGWRSTFLTETREGAEEKLKELGSTWEWLPDGSLKTITKALPAVRHDNGPGRTQTRNFFNSMVAAYTGWNDSRNVGPKSVLLGDDSPLDPEAMADAEAIMDEICVAFRWQQGDLLLLDNRTAMHARRPFSGPRRILASLVRDPVR